VENLEVSNETTILEEWYSGYIRYFMCIKLFVERRLYKKENTPTLRELLLLLFIRQIHDNNEQNEMKRNTT
jgi:hypothetical protein